MSYHSIVIVIAALAIGLSAADDNTDENSSNFLKSNGRFKMDAPDDGPVRVLLNNIPGLPRTYYSAADQARWIDGHNNRRRTEGAANMNKLQWDHNLAEMAQGWAERCKFMHGHIANNGWQRVTGWDWIGQNLYVGWSNPPRDVNVAMKGWYDDEKPYYNFDQIECMDSGPQHIQCGHYTAMAWADTEYVGCGAHLCQNMIVDPKTNQQVRDGWNVVCNYGPGGNIRAMRPYVKGTPCSKCATDLPQCDNGLCTKTVTNRDRGRSGVVCRCSAWVEQTCSAPCNVQGTTSRHRTCNPASECTTQRTLEVVRCQGICGNVGGCQCSPWGVWGTCPSHLQCGQQGNIVRSRTCFPPSQCGGQSNSQSGPVCYGQCTGRSSCQCRPWSSWSTCSAAACGQQGTRDRKRGCTPAHLCTQTSQQVACMRPCTSQDSCRCGPWSRGLCDSQCMVTFSRTCNPPALCQNVQHRARVVCTGGSCGTSCRCQMWSQWGCPAECGEQGLSTRTRTCNPATSQCQPKETAQVCTGKCTGGCECGQWTGYTCTSKVCGQQGVQVRFRQCTPVNKVECRRQAVGFGSSCIGQCETGWSASSSCYRVCQKAYYLMFRTQPCTSTNCFSPVKLQTRTCSSTGIQWPCIYPCGPTGACQRYN